ncbi:MAG: glycosyltransferase family 25 protein [Gemmatimonadaceae bacterium]|jgi:glycosyl transferase family 25
MTGFPPVFVISLSRSVERRAHISRQLSALGVSWEFVDAVDGLELAAEELDRVVGASNLEVLPGVWRRLTRGEIGCALSHQRCYRLILARDLPMAFVFEDDVDVRSSFVEVANALARFPVNWELVLFAHHSARNGPRAGAETTWYGATVHPEHRVRRVVEFAMGAMAYLVSRAGARKLLTYGTPVRMPADWVTGYAPSAGVRLHAVTPPVVTPSTALSHGTTLPDREASWEAGPDVRRQPPIAAGLRSWGGTGLLWLRKAGVWPSAYSRRY